jgi:hypothetical protein
MPEYQKKTRHTMNISVSPSFHFINEMSSQSNYLIFWSKNVILFNIWIEYQANSHGIRCICQKSKILKRILISQNLVQLSIDTLEGNDNIIGALARNQSTALSSQKEKKVI